VRREGEICDDGWMSLSAMLFVDYQNVYRWARRAFEIGDEAAARLGQFDPTKLALLLEEKGRGRFSIDQIRIYRGMPGQRHDHIGYAAAQRQIHFWRKNKKVNVFTRPLRYPKNWDIDKGGEKPKEKGIDVALAVDFVAMAFKKQYELGLIFSADTDLRPALEYVNSEEVEPKGEVVAWRGIEPHYELSSKKSAYCHWINTQEFSRVSDRTSFTN
jgi:uncharacterized LabA/DUF88 family protein